MMMLFGMRTFVFDTIIRTANWGKKKSFFLAYKFFFKNIYHFSKMYHLIYYCTGNTNDFLVLLLDKSFSFFS